MSEPTQSPAARPLRLLATLINANPFLGGDAWRRAVGDHVARVQAVTDELARIEARNLARARTLVDESARLTHATLTYSAQLSSAWHKLMTDAARHTLDLVNPGSR
jgi:hypothetical protein